MFKTVTYVAFSDEQSLLKAAKELVQRNIPLVDAYTPFPIHGLDEVLGERRSRLPIVCFVAASLGFLLSFWFQIWTSAENWPINVGGKPFISIPAFIPVTFEVTVLFGGLVSVAAFFFRNRLFPGKKALSPHASVTNDGFWLAIEQQGARLDSVSLVDILEGLGGTQVRTEENGV